jgi:hypothetical protein
MKTKSTITMLFALFLASGSFAGDNLNKMQQRIDSLEVRLDQISVAYQNNPYSRGITEDWGAGLFCSSKTGTDYSMNFELGYIFKIGKPFTSSSREYLGNRTDYRLGFSIGAQMFDDEVIFSDNSTFYKCNGYGGFGKFNFGSPILLNFISFSGHLKAMYTKPESGNERNITNARTVVGYGFDMEYWYKENLCVSLGYTDEGDSYLDDKKDSIYPSKIRFVFGMKTFF